MSLKTALLIGALAVSSSPASATHRDQPIAGPYVGWYELDGARRSIATVWHERRDGTRVMATALAAQDSFVFAEGSLTGSSLSMAVQSRLGPTLRDVSIEALAIGPLIVGDIIGSESGGRLVLWRSRSLTERGLVLAETDDDGNPIRAVSAAVAIGELGVLVAGRFGPAEEPEEPGECSAVGCWGDVVSFRERGTRLTLQLRSDGACELVTDIALTFDSSTYLYTGSYTARSCDTVRTGTLLAARHVGTNSDHAAEILAALGRLADDLESDEPLPRPHPSFMSDYVYSGRTLDDLLDGYEQEGDFYSMRRAVFDRVRAVRTIVDPLMFPGLDVPPLGAEFDERREGSPAIGGAREVYADSRTRPGPPRLSLWTQGPAGWVIRGNGFAGIDLPFVYRAGANGTLEVPTPGGTLFASVGPYGMHTGHVDGDAKTNFAGFFSNGYDDMVDLGDGDGVREPGEPWGYYGGVSGERIRNRIPSYVAPAEATLDAIVFEAVPGFFYFDGAGQWGVTLRFADDTRLHLGHLGRVSATLRDRVLAELGIDVWAYAGPPAVVVGPGSGIRIAAGEDVAQPQVVATEYAAFPGYYTARNAGSGVDVPWAQMEFAFIGPVAGAHDADVCIYEFFPRATALALQRVLDDDMANPASLRFERNQADKWIWAAEGRLCNAYSPLPNDFSSLDTRLGGWYERPLSDEIVAFVTMARDTVSFDPLLYDARNKGRLVRRMHAFAAPWTWAMPDGTTARPFFPAGELLERTDSALLVKWRNIGYRDASGADRPAYQWASYRLDRRLGLRIHWGPFLNAAEDGVPPPLSDVTPCNGLTVVCYDHEFKPGY
jgi:hypothetical protein